MTFDKVEKETEMSHLTVTGNPIIESAPPVAPNKNVALQNPIMEVKKITTDNQSNPAKSNPPQTI